MKLNELPTGSTPLIRMALLEAIDSVACSLASFEIIGKSNLRSLGTLGRKRYNDARKEYKRRLVAYRKILKQLGGAVKGDVVSGNKLDEVTHP